jgi:PAS domain-containing protein
MTMEVQFRASNGKVHDGILCTQGRAGRQTYLISTFVDTTERKRAEQALKDSQERLDLALDSAQLGTWDWHIPAACSTARPAPRSCTACRRSLS